MTKKKIEFDSSDCILFLNIIHWTDYSSCESKQKKNKTNVICLMKRFQPEKNTCLSTYLFVRFCFILYYVSDSYCGQT